MSRRWIILTTACAVLASVPASAFVASAKTIVRRFSETQAFDHSRATPLLGSARLLDQPQLLLARMELAKTGCRSQIVSAQGKSLVSLVSGRVTAEGTSLPALEAFVALGCPLLSARDSAEDEVEAAVTRFAETAGVNLAVSSLSRVDGRVGYVVGARPREVSKPQFWIDKQTNRLLRVIGSHGGQLWDVRFVDGASIATNRTFPRTASVWKNGEKQLEIRLMAVTPKLPSDGTGSDFVEEDSD